MGNKQSQHIKNQLEMYPILVDRMPQGIATVNEEGIILYCNPSFAEMVSLPSNQVLGTKLHNYIAEISKAEFDDLYKQSLRGPVNNEIHLNDHATMVMPVIISTNTFDLGDETMLSVILTDVSARNKNRNVMKVQAEELEKKLQQLQESEERFRLLVENVKDYSIIMLDPDGNIKTWNKGAERIKGYTSREIIGKHISIVYTKEEIEGNEPGTNLKMAKKLGRYESEAWRVRKDGSTFFADVIISALYDAENNFRGYAKITRDITERKQSEEKLKDSETQIQTIFKRAPDAVTVIDDAGNITRWNPRAEEIFGWSAEEAIGQPLHNLIVPERYREAHSNGMKHFLATGEGSVLNKPLEMAALLKNNSEIQVELSISHFQFKKKDFFIGFLKDITERKITEDKLKESEERFLKIFANSPVATTLSEVKSNKIAFANTLFYDTFGYSEQEVIGHTSEQLSLIAPDEYNRVIAVIMESLGEKRTLDELQALPVEDTEALLLKLKQGNTMNNLEIQYTRKNGETFYAILFYEAIRIGNQSYTITSYQDITERKIAEEKVKQKSRELELLNQELALKNKESEKRATQLSIANIELIFQIEEKEKKDAALRTANTDLKEKEELIAHKDGILAILSHDLRSPLTGIIGAAKHLQAHVEVMNPNQRKEILTLLYEAAIKELNMLDYLVEWARIKYASDVFSPAQIKLANYVNQVFDNLKDTAAMHTISLCHEIEENTTVFADGKMLLSIIQNIVSNAIKHSRPDGKIIITATQSGNEIIVEIKDTGIGMSIEIQKNLFTPQMDSLSKERKHDKGAGIGLLLVKGFLEKNGGRIWVESEEGVGSSFYFTLPITGSLNKIA
ncbi:PAS domain-containing sensor histidine kinase [Flavobacterium caseinilyticum]|uniref:histidine kinase n=1 Tax=Flavobacterium caseinilyticum TaxID=2541732 RepID=A0A4R5AQF3_9FLAO|nr:PAS domain-containing sensor histidine kinase [Flavobacterium caseinilyticum]TDD74405.1 PAS domain-containing sensor histidine kinase [Flavobacterium caseinilyticum]